MTPAPKRTRPTAAACALCSATKTDRAGALEHQPWCPHFMRGPDPGGDPHEWPSLLDALDEEHG